MTKDRLAALRAGQSDDTSLEDADDTVVLIIETEESKFMEQFFEEINELRGMVQHMTEAIEEVGRKHTQILTATANDKMMKEELEELTRQIQRTANEIRDRLKVIEQDIALRDKKNETSAAIRIRKTQHASILRGFVDLMNQYNQAQVEFRVRCKARIKRQLEICGKQTTDDDVENLLDENNTAVFTQDIVVETEEIRKSLADIEARRQDMIKLEKSLKELHDLFSDLLMLVQSQGEVIDRIEFNVDQAIDYLDSANVKFRDAVQYRNKARRKKICIAICCLVLVGLIVVILGTVGGVVWKKK